MRNVQKLMINLFKSNYLKLNTTAALKRNICHVLNDTPALQNSRIIYSEHDHSSKLEHEAGQPLIKYAVEI